MAWAGRTQPVSRHPCRRHAVKTMTAQQVIGVVHQFVIQNGAAVDQMRAKGRFDAEEGKRMSRAHPPMRIETGPDVRVHDAALDKPPQKINLAVGQRQRGRRSKTRRGGHGALSGKPNGAQNLDRGIEMTQQLPTRNRRHH